MSANAHAYNRIYALIFVLLVTAVLKWSRWRNAKAAGMSTSQFADEESTPGKRLLLQAQWFRFFGWSCIVLPIVGVAISQFRHRDTLFMLIGGMVFLEIFIGGLGWFMLWMAGQCEERARRMEATL
jgi:hypothetical protein